MHKALLVLTLITMAASSARELPPYWLASDDGCACSADDGPCRITNCSGIGSGTGNGSSSSFDIRERDPLSRPPQPPETDRNPPPRNGSAVTRPDTK